MAVPVALKPLLRIVPALGLQERRHLRIAAFDLVLARPAVVREVVAAVMVDRQIDQLAERVGRVLKLATGEGEMGTLR